MFDFLKSLEYYVGIQYEEKLKEFSSNVTHNASEAYEVARIAYKDNPNLYKMTFYAKRGAELKEILYSQIKHLDNLSHSKLEKELEKMCKELFKKKA
jgi:hypothetical protein